MTKDEAKYWMIKMLMISTEHRDLPWLWAEFFRNFILERPVGQLRDMREMNMEAERFLTISVLEGLREGKEWFRIKI